MDPAAGDHAEAPRQRHGEGGKDGVEAQRDPAGIAAAEPRGLHRLYVVLTRAVSTLVVLHRGDLPAALAA